MTWLTAILAIFEKCKGYIFLTLAFYTGKLSQNNNNAKEALEVAKEANKIRANTAAESHDDRLQYMRKRKLLRDISANNSE